MAAVISVVEVAEVIKVVRVVEVIGVVEVFKVVELVRKLPRRKKGYPTSRPPCKRLVKMTKRTSVLVLRPHSDLLFMPLLQWSVPVDQWTFLNLAGNSIF